MIWPTAHRDVALHDGLVKHADDALILQNVELKNKREADDHGVRLPGVDTKVSQLTLNRPSIQFDRLIFERGKDPMIRLRYCSDPKWVVKPFCAGLIVILYLFPPSVAMYNSWCNLCLALIWLLSAPSCELVADSGNRKN